MTISELITGVLVDLGVSPFDACPAISCDTGPPLAISCLVLAVNNALNGCNQPAPTATPTTAAPKLSLGLEVVGFPDQQQTVVVAVLTHFGGEAVAYEFGCTAMCYPQFKQAITFQVTGPNGDVILDNCGAPALCAEGAVAFAPGESLQQALAVTGIAFEQRCDLGDPSQDCTQVALAAGHYTVWARFDYTIGRDSFGPEYEIAATASFDWPPATETPQRSPTAPEPTASPSPTRASTCASLPDNAPCLGPCGPCNPSQSGYCRAGQCVTECAPCVTPTPTPVTDCRSAPDYVPCTGSCGLGICFLGRCGADECAPTPTPTVTATPRCPSGDGLCVGPCGVGHCEGSYCSADECTPSVTATATTPHPPTVTATPTGSVPEQVVIAQQMLEEILARVCQALQVEPPALIETVSPAPGGAVLECCNTFGCPDDQEGHYGSVRIRGYQAVEQAAAAFGPDWPDAMIVDVEGTSIQDRTSIPPNVASDGGLSQQWKWKTGCWVVTGNAFDDTHFLLSPQPGAVISALLHSSRAAAVFDSCLPP